MHDLPELWLPILVAAVLVFVASSLIHMVFKWHNPDYRRLSNEDEVQSALRASTSGPGQYSLPFCQGMKDMQSEAVQRKYAEGPVALITVWPPGPPKMGPILAKWFLLNLVFAAVVAAVVLHVYGRTGDPRSVAHLAATLTFLTYAGASLQQGIWMGKPWISVAKELLDGGIYALVTWLAFLWLWP